MMSTPSDELLLDMGVDLASLIGALNLNSNANHLARELREKWERLKAPGSVERLTALMEEMYEKWRGVLDAGGWQPPPNFLEYLARHLVSIGWARGPVSDSEALVRVREIHYDRHGECPACCEWYGGQATNTLWPCPTIKALDAR